MLKLPARIAQKWLTPAAILLAAGSAALYISSTHTKAPQIESRTFASGLEVNVDRSSPVFAALEDTVENFEYSDDEAVSPYAPVEILNAGADFVARAQEIIAENSAEQSVIALEQKYAEQRTQESVRKIQAFLAAAFSRPAAVSHEASSQPQNKIAANEGSASRDLDSDGSDTAAGMLVVENGNFREYQPAVDSASASVASETTRTINLAELKIDKKELLKSLFFPLVVAEKHASDSRKTANAASAQRTVQRGTAAQAMDRGSAAGLANERSAQKDVVSEQGIANQEFKARTISGNIDMLGGLAITSAKDQVVVYREVDEERMESGYVWIKEGRYEIYLEDNQGDLVTELINAQGVVLGRGELDLRSLNAATKQINLKLSPIPHGLYGRTQSAYSYGDKVDVVADAEISYVGLERSARSNRQGEFVDEDINAGSVVLTRVQRPNYWSTLAFTTPGAETALTLFPDKMMNAFTSVVGLDTNMYGRQPPVIWGKVTQNGHPVAGAKVEMLTGDQPLQPVYFNALLIPDRSLNATSSNGMYAFVPVEPGVNVVQVTFGSDSLEPVVVPAEVGYVTTIDLEVARHNQVLAKVFDAFQTNIPLSAEVKALGAKEPKLVTGSGSVEMRMADSHGLMVLDADAGDHYAITRLSLTGGRKTLAIPMIEQTWLDHLRDTNRISRSPDSGVAVGFVQATGRYQVYASGNSPSTDIKVMYFDRNGQSLETDYGVPGGGYVAYNLPEGITTISIVVERMQGVQATTVLTERSVTNVLNHTIR